MKLKFQKSVVLLIVFYCFCIGASALELNSLVGSPAPEFLMKGVDGGDFGPGAYSGQLILLSFIQAHNSSRAEFEQATRAQLTFIKSMMRQYGGAGGLRLMLITGAHPETGPGEEVLINFLIDNELTHIPLLKDTASDVADLYHVDALPTTFLISANGIISQRWNNVALPAQLAQAIEAEIAGRQTNDKWSTAARTIFHGIPAARPFSEKCWLADGGKRWQSAVSQPIRLLVLDDVKSKSARLLIRQFDGSRKDALEISLDEIPEDECGKILSKTEATSSVFTGIKDIQIDNPGKYILEIFVDEQSLGVLQLTVE